MAKKRILLVEDQQDSARVLRDALESLDADLEVAEKSSAEQALRVLESGAFDLLVADVLLPGLSGIELMGQVSHYQPNTKTILVSGVPDPEIRKEVARAGADAFFFKPIELADFLDAVERVLGLVESHLPNEMQLLREQMEQAEEEAGTVGEHIRELRQQQNALCVALINERGQILALAGTLPDKDIESTLMPDLLSMHFASQRVAAFNPETASENMLSFRWPAYHLHLSSIGASYALLLATSPLQPEAYGELAEASRQAVALLSPVLIKLEAAVYARAKDQPKDDQVQSSSQDEPDEKLEDMLHEAETKPMQYRQVDRFWEDTKEELLNPPPRGGALTYEQASQLGLAPIEEN